MRLIKGIFALIIILTFYINASSQTENINLLKNQLNIATAEEKPAILYLIAEEYSNRNFALSKDYALKTIKAAQKINNKELEARSNHLIAEQYYNNKNYKRAIDYYDDEYDIRKSFGDKKDLALLLYKLAFSHQQLDNNRRSSKYFEESLILAEQINFQYLTKKIYQALYEVNYERKRYKDAIDYLKAYISIVDSDFKKEIEQEIGQLKENTQKFKQELNKVKKTKEEVESELIEKDKTIQDKETEIKEKDSTLMLKDSTLNIVSEEKKQLEELTEEQKLEIKNLNLEKQLNQKEIENQKLYASRLYIIIGFSVLFAIVLYLRFRQKKKSNNLLQKKNDQILEQNKKIKENRDELIRINSILTQQKEEIEAQRDEIEYQNEKISTNLRVIEKKNQNITDSITYASRIQQIVLPSFDFVKKYFTDYFVYYNPKDIVSGDFYWNFDTEDKLYFAAADCTGHGVPGAFMSMLGVAFLNETITRKNITEAHHILEELRTMVKKYLKQTQESAIAKDGMDIALCTYNKKNKTLEFAGANNPMYLLRENAINIYSAVKNPIGIYKKEKEFVKFEIEPKQNDILYLFSDGFPDQFGGPKKRKYKLLKFQKFLLEIHQKPLELQQKLIDNEFKTWKGENDQIDDILIIGIKI